jgi:hypothetical protein
MSDLGKPSFISSCRGVECNYAALGLVGGNSQYSLGWAISQGY